MPSKDIERSESGAEIYRHNARKREWTPPQDSARHLEEVEEHVEKYIGKVETVFHEIVSDLVHLDVLLVPATDERPYHVLVTSGVSDKAMNVPEGLEQYRYAELLIALPTEWPLTQAAFKEESNYWPLQWLKQIGRLPHEYETWIGWGHTIPNGDPAKPIADTKFTGVMLTPPYELGGDFFRLATRSGDVINFYVMVPLYKDEMDLKLKQGADEITERFERRGIGFVLDKKRPNVAKKKGWFGR